MSDGIPCLWMRGGTSKGAFFLGHDLPADPAARDALLLAIMGSPDARQIDGIGGADPLSSKVAVLSRTATLAPATTPIADPLVQLADAAEAGLDPASPPPIVAMASAVATRRFRVLMWFMVW